MKSLILAAVIAATPAAAMTKHDTAWFHNLALNFAVAKTAADFCPGATLNKEIFLKKMEQIQNKKEENYFFEVLERQTDDLMAHLRGADVKQWCEDQKATMKTFTSADAPIIYTDGGQR